MITENLSTLKIYKLTKEQYESRIASGDIEDNAIYLTPEEHDALFFEASYDSDTSTNYLVGVTFDELDSYALQNKMVILYRNFDDGSIRMYRFVRRVIDGEVTRLLYSHMYDSSHYYYQVNSDGTMYSYVSNLMTYSNPTGTGKLSMNRLSGSTSGSYSTTLGYDNTASGNYSCAEGYNTIASNHSSHAEGRSTTASGSISHAEGWSTTASGSGSHAEGFYTIASGGNQHVQGKFNIEDTTSAHIVGNGTSDSARSNAHTLDFNGNAWFAGDVYVGSTSGTNKDDGSKKLATEEYVNTKTDNLQTALDDLDVGIEILESSGTKTEAFIYDNKQFYEIGTLADDISDIYNPEKCSFIVEIAVYSSTSLVYATREVQISKISTGEREYGAVGSPYYVCYYSGVGSDTITINNKDMTYTVQLAFSNNNKRSVCVYCSAPNGIAKVTSIKLMENIKTVFETHVHDDRYYIKNEIDTKIDDVLETTKEYADNAAANAASIQFITWESDD